MKRKRASGTRNHPKTPANIALCPFLAKRGLPSGQRLGCTGCETAGLPLGLCAVKFWTRDKFKGTAALKRKINPTRVPIEKKESIRWLENLKQSTELLDDPGRCIHIGDRESDIYELFCTAQEVGTHFLVRTCVDRLAGDGNHTVADEMDVTSVKGLHRIEVRDGKGDLEEAILEIRYRRIRILPPVGKQKRYPALTLTSSMPRNRRRRRIGRKSIGSSSPTCRSNRAKTPSRSSNGMRCAGRSRCSIRSSNQAARLRNRGCGPPNDWRTSSRCFAF